MDENDSPRFLLPVAEEPPVDRAFYFLRHRASEWEKTRITKTLYLFYASCLQLDGQGVSHAYMITEIVESIVKEDMDE